MAVEIILPRVDMDMTSGKISRWFVAEGGAVRKGQVLFEIETTKAAMEIEAPADGILSQVTVKEGQEVPVGQVVALLLAEGEAAPVAAPSTTPEAPAQAAAPVVASQPVAAPVIAAPAIVPQPEVRVLSGVTATPLAKRMARLAGIDLATVRGSGPLGRVQAADVEARSASSAQGLVIHELRKGEGLPVVFIHGFASDSTIWRSLVRSLEGSNPCFGLDLPAHGRSPGDVPADFDALVDQVAASLLVAGLGKAHLVGHSLGGAVATALSLRHGFDIASLTLLTPAGLGPAINAAFLDGFCSAKSAASLTPWMASLMAQPHGLLEAMVKAELDLRQSPARAAALRLLAQRIFPDGTQGFSVRHGLKDPRQPTKVILGLADSLLPAAQADGLGGLVAVHRLAGIGHVPQLESPDIVRRLVAENIRAGG